MTRLFRMTRLRLHVVSHYCSMAILVHIIFFLYSTDVNAQQSKEKIHFTLSMQNPATHYFHVELNCNGFTEDTLTFTMPVWSPGYYWIINFPKNVTNFRVTDSSGIPLAWRKTDKNKWQVITKQSAAIRLSYEVYANTQSVAEPFLDDSHAFIMPTGLLVYPEGYLSHDATISIQPYSNWKSVSTGLEPVKEKPFTYYAADFDEMFDCPIYAGNQTVLSFDVQGIPHYVAFENPGNFDTGVLLADLQKMVTTASAIIGEIPYKHYTFIIMGEGRGGLEHRNSTAVFSSGTVYSQQDTAGYKRWLAFLSHEYFHHYNIKRIRPIALGPFDYSKENLTNMLWVSEGLTVYYEYIALNRAGIFSKEEVYAALQSNIRNYENIPGHLFQPVTQASYDTWIQFFSRGDNASNTQISYYDKGCALGALLDFAIRHATNNTKSLDDVMRTLYYDYYKKQHRGFTDEEFRQVCETVAGRELSEVFEYASTTKEIDYKKYFGWAGLDIDTDIKTTGTRWTGATFRKSANGVVVSGIEWNTPAWFSGLSTGDQVLEVDGVPAGQDTPEKLINNKKPGDTVTFRFSRNGATHSLQVTVTDKTDRSFSIAPKPGAEQFKGWLQ